MVFDPNNTVLITEQPLNANQFDPLAPVKNTVPHNVLWDFAQNKLQWVNTLTGVVEKELEGVSVNSGVFKIIKVASLTFEDLNNAPASDMLNIAYPASLPPDVVFYGGYYNITEEFTRTGFSATLDIFSLLEKNSNNGAQPFFLGGPPIMTSGVPTVAGFKQYSAPGQFIVNQIKTDTAQDSWVFIQLTDNSNPFNNPQDFTAGNMDIYLQYIDFQI